MERAKTLAHSLKKKDIFRIRRKQYFNLPIFLLVLLILQLCLSNFIMFSFSSYFYTWAIIKLNFFKIQHEMDNEDELKSPAIRYNTIYILQKRIFQMCYRDKKKLKICIKIVLNSIFSIYKNRNLTRS